MKRTTRLRWFAKVWPPMLFTGIRLEHLAEDWRSARVRLRLRWYNRNYVGTQFGGSLFAMTDPWWMILVMECLGRDYIVWDRAAEIRFVKPGRRDVLAEFRVEEALLGELRDGCKDGERVLRWFETEVRDAVDDELIAVVRKQLYVKLKGS